MIMVRKLYWVFTTVIFALAVLLHFAPTQVAYSQEGISVECGQILDAEFTDNLQEHIYLLDMAPRDSFEVSIQPAGDFLQTAIVAYGPSGLVIAGNGETTIYHNSWSPLAYSVEKSPTLPSGILSATGIYRIRVANTWIMGENSDLNNFTEGNTLLSEQKYFGGVGLYTLSIGCTDRNGNKIEPGDIAQPTATPAPLPTATPRAALPSQQSGFDGIGFPGLAPVDFADAVTLPLLLDTTMTGVIPIDNQILGFTLDAEANGMFELNYARVSGNMNLGVVVLSENNEVFFQASLVTSESLSTRFVLPEAGQYTIGVFRISLVEPVDVKPTAFQITGSLLDTK